MNAEPPSSGSGSAAAHSNTVDVESCRRMPQQHRGGSGAAAGTIELFSRTNAKAQEALATRRTCSFKISAPPPNTNVRSTVKRRSKRCKLFRRRTSGGSWYELEEEEELEDAVAAGGGAAARDEDDDDESASGYSHTRNKQHKNICSLACVTKKEVRKRCSQHNKASNERNAKRKFGKGTTKTNSQ